MITAFAGWIGACGWIRGIMVHKGHPGAPINPDLFVVDRLTMHWRTRHPSFHGSVRGPVEGSLI